jgi:outer membrane protein
MGSCRSLTVALPAALLAILLIAAASAAADKGVSKRRPQDAPRLSLADAVASALARNLKISDGMLAIQESEHQRREAYSDFFPSVDLQYLGAGYRYRQSGVVQSFAMSHDSRRAAAVALDANGNPHFGSYPYRIDPYRTFTLAATLTQPIYTGGKLLSNYKYARLGVDYSELDLGVRRQDLTLEVYQAYFDMIQGQKLLDVANQSIRALESLRNQTVEFYKAGVVPKVDVLATEGQLAQARIQRTQAATDIEKARSALCYLLRYPQESPLEIVEDLKYEPTGYGVPGIYNTAIQNRLEIRQANISVEQALALVKAAQSDLLPSVALQAQGSRTNDDWNPLDHEAINAWKLQGVFTWAFDTFRTRETVKEKRVGQARAFVQAQLLVEQIMNEVKEAYLDMKRAESDIQDNRKAVEFRSENFRINQERYKEQVATYTEVLDAQRQLSQAQGDYYISLVSYRINLAVLERQMGIIR